MALYKVLKAPAGQSSLRYKTRRLLPGDVFEIDDSLDGRVWSGILLAKRHIIPHREPGKIASPPKRLLSQLDHDGNGEPGGSKSAPASDDLATLRTEYHAKIGKRPFNGWDADTLRAKIGEAE